MIAAETDLAAKLPAVHRWAEPKWITAAADRGWTWARTNWNRAANVPGAWFDAAKADAVVERWPRWFKLTNDRFYDKPFRLNAWQEIIVRMLVGWKIPADDVDCEFRLKPATFSETIPATIPT